MPAGAWWRRCKRDGDVRVVVMLHAEDPAGAVKTALAKLT